MNGAIFVFWALDTRQLMVIFQRTKPTRVFMVMWESFTTDSFQITNSCSRRHSEKQLRTSLTHSWSPVLLVWTLKKAHRLNKQSNLSLSKVFLEHGALQSTAPNNFLSLLTQVICFWGMIARTHQWFSLQMICSLTISRKILAFRRSRKIN